MILDNPPIYIISFLILGIFSIITSKFVHKKYTRGGTNYLAYSFFSVGLLAISSCIQMLYHSLLIARVLVIFDFLLVIFIANFWVLFAAEYTTDTFSKNTLLKKISYIFVITGLLVAITNSFHGTFWSNLEIMTQPFTHYTISKEIGNYIYSVGVYIYLIIGGVLLCRSFYSSNQNKSIYAVALGFLILFISSFVDFISSYAITHSTFLNPIGMIGLVCFTFASIYLDLFKNTRLAQRNIIETFPHPFIAIRKDGEIIDFNDNYVKEFAPNMNHIELTGKYMQEDFPELFSALAEMKEDRIIICNEAANTDIYQVCFSRITTGPHTIGYTIILENITRTITSEEEIERHDANLDKFADSAAHDLRNPLTVVLGRIEEAKRRNNSAEQNIEPHLETAYNNASKMEEIITDYLTVLRSAKTVEEVQPLSFNNLISSQKPINSDITITVTNDGILHANPQRVGLILKSIFRNIEYRTEDKTSVRAYITENGFIIEDDAGEIEKEDLEILLKYGYTTTHRGTGLGLSIAKTLAEAHKWSLKVDPEYSKGIKIVIENAKTE